MKEALKIFVPAFLLFSAVGAVAGYGDRIQAARQQLYAGLEIRRNAGEYFFAYRCSDEGWTYEYAVDSNTGRRVGPTSALLALQTTALGVPSARHLEYAALAGTFLGGATGGVTFRDVAMRRPIAGGTWNYVRRTIIGIIGAVTGYAAGHYVGSHYDTGCDSTIFAGLLGDRQLWIDFEKERIGLTIRELQALEDALRSPSGNVIYSWQKDPAFRCSTAFVSALRRLDAFLSATIRDPVSADFQLLDEIGQLHNRLVASREYATLVKLAPARAMADMNEAGARLSQSLGDAKGRWEQACTALDMLTRTSPP